MDSVSAFQMILSCVQAAALVALTGVQGLVRLVGTGSTVDGRQWMILQPFGYLMPVDASAACKLHALTQLVASIEHLKTAKYLHGDISHYNVMFTSASGTGDLFLVDLGTTRKLTEVGFAVRLFLAILVVGLNSLVLGGIT